MAEKDLYLWAENTTYNSGEVTVIKYKTGSSRNLAGVCFKISVVSGYFPAVEDSGSTYQLSDCVDQAKQGTNFSGAAADIYSADGNKWVLCSGNSSKNIITLAGTVGLSSSDTGPNVLAYLYGGVYTIDSILSAANSSAQSYTSQAWTYQVGNPNPNTAPTGISFTEESELTADHTGKVGTLATTDADVGDTHTYTLTTTGGAAHASLEIGGASSDEVHVKSSATIAEQDYTFKITTNDGNGGTFSKDFTVTFSAAGGGDASQTITLNTGWNLISFYVELNGGHPSAVFDELISNNSNLLFVSQWINGGFKTYNPAQSRGNTLSSIVNGYGYWVRTSEEQVISKSGAKLNGPLQLSAGWNLVSFYLENNTLHPSTVFGELISNNNLLFVSQWINGGFKTYNPAQSRGNTLSTIVNGYGYWVRTNDAVTDFYLSSG